MKTIETAKKTLLASSISAVILSLAACGGGGGSDGGSSNTVQMSGAVVDDYIAYSRIYVDVNNNGKFDAAFEPYAYTDVNGYFSKSKTGKDYCALNPKTDYDYRYCFRAESSVETGGVIRVDKGTGRDTLTTQLYNATMSLLMNGNASGLRVTALSTAKQVVNDPAVVAEAKSKLGMTDTQIKNVQDNYVKYVTAYLGTTTSTTASVYTAATLDVDKVDPLQFTTDKAGVDKPSRAFKLAIQLHKMAEAIAKGLIPTSGTGSTLKTGDILPQVYFALLKNMPFDSTSQDVFSLKTPSSGSALNIGTVISDVISLLGSKYPSVTFNSLASTNYVILAKYLNCTLGDGTDTAISQSSLDVGYKTGAASDCGTILASNDTNGRNKLFAAELGTSAVQDSKTGTVLDNAKNPAQTTGYVVKDNDFVTASSSVNGGGTAAAKTKSFDTVVQQFNTKHIALTKSGADKVATYFKDDGSVTICQEQTNGTKNLFTGSWKQDPDKPAVMYISYLGIAATITNLDPSNSVCSGNAQCVSISFPNLDSATSSTTPVISQTYTSSSTDGLLADGGGSTAPTSASACTFN